MVFGASHDPPTVLGERFLFGDERVVDRFHVVALVGVEIRFLALGLDLTVAQSGDDDVNLRNRSIKVIGVEI